MADLARPCGRIRPASPHLPVSWYFDPEIFALEKKLLFDAGSNYVGHELMVPNVGDYHTLPWTERREDAGAQRRAGVELLSNVCRHRQSIMLEGRGNAAEHRLPAAPLDLRPEGRAARRAALPREPRASSCTRRRCTNWNGLLFAGPRDPRKDLARITTMADWDFSGYVLDSVRVDEYDINWKTFVETYLEVYHVDYFHPGLGNFTDCDNFTVDYGDEYSVQIVAAEGRPRAARARRCTASGTRPA